MKSSDYTELRAFQAVAERGTFVGAAGALRITPSALSQVIRRFEDKLGTRLFQRTTRSVALTDAGQRLYARLRPALAEMDAALEETRGQAGKVSGRVKLHVTEMAADAVLAPVLGQFHAQYPNIVLDIVTESSFVDIIAAGYDAGIRLGEFVQQDMVAYPLGPALRMVAAASPDYLKRCGTPLTPADLSHHQCINWCYPGGVYRWEFYQRGHWISLALEGPLVTTRRELGVAAALQGVGITFWTEDKLRPWLDSGELMPLLREYCPPFLGWHLFYPRQRNMPGAFRALVDFLRAHYPADEDSVNKSPE
ncbi:LysR family transcriptional regulator [Martelella alba]|uniref:LysR family transcriptional regulator n=1 Tax=Martelella alba TaxID=2590451 RepID=A0ABY2SDV6_9HYPH|nr:LysR family transcriptional regulator [Martelella alba]TKI02362.1 LysR family transcriptional regulator [Martelella alba]